jgi:hypothetical protein
MGFIDHRKKGFTQLKLYELAEHYNTINKLLDDGAQDAELIAQLENIQEQFNLKVENIGKLILSLEGETQILKSELERLISRKNSTEKKIDWLKSYLLFEMIKANQEKIKGSVLTCSVRTNQPSCNVVDETLIPSEYMRVIPEKKEADKSKILTTFKTFGEIIPGVEIVRDRKSLSIK